MKTKTEIIKAKFSNQVHKLLNPNPVKNSERWKQKKVELTNAEKVALFDTIAAMDKAVTQELGAYWFKRREKKRVEQRRAKQAAEGRPCRAWRKIAKRKEKKLQKSLVS